MFFFLVDEGIEDPNITINGPSSACQRNAISMAFRWRADSGPTLNAGLVALWFHRGSGPVLLRKSLILLFFRGSGPPFPPLDPHMIFGTYRIAEQQNTLTSLLGAG